MADEKDIFLELRHISKQFGSFTALEDINLKIKKGEFVCLLGPSGCGKTTLLRIIAGLEKPNQGQVMIQGKDATALPPGKRNFGIVFQSYALFPNMTVRQNIAFGLKKYHLSREEENKKIETILDQVNLISQIDKYPMQLSGGQQQRIALARALVVSPDFLLLDEPLSALDAKVRQKVRKEIRSLQQRLGITTIMVTHDQEEALTMADTIVVMNNACVMQSGSPVEVYNHPQNPFVADFIGSINFFRNDLLASANLTSDRELVEGLSLNSMSLKACRPENVEIVEPRSLNSFNAVIHDVEFHGYGYRLLLELSGDNTPVNSDYLSFDVSSEDFFRMGLEKGKPIAIRFKRGCICYFNSEEDTLAGA
ncbi:MAG: putative 2-aminoethylphosphonate ABC transporter ATP-binding protein [Oscillospiraceae bacterium]|nr:putative 2-aminoethylphosphonate ABC transporter ATP-binding protein [Oscillospiraceae bacterium]